MTALIYRYFDPERIRNISNIDTTLDREKWALRTRDVRLALSSDATRDSTMRLPLPHLDFGSADE